MAAFDCRGYVTVSVDEAMPFIDITVRHEENHVPYCDVSLPPDVKAVVQNSLDKNVTQIWNDVLTLYPSPNFTRKSVYRLWYSLVRGRWSLDSDQVLSAEKLLERGEEAGGLGAYSFKRISLDIPDGYSAISFSIPEMIERWGGRLREVAIDSAWGTNKGGYEIFSLLGEAYGSGMPLGYLLVKSIGKAAPNSKQHLLEQFLRHFRDEYKLTVNFTLSDKDFAEIGACRSVFPRAKHQLCFWHCLRAVKRRLSILRRQPAHYDWQEAVSEFTLIEPTFLPKAQRSSSTHVSSHAPTALHMLTSTFDRILYHPKNLFHS
ncbi:hypothetical protein BOTBODRAFT_110345 [Botryobasidium botryosum FD-172 SS1]|uniref:MULE transposase domain-containing protein n=1 Tax=Botryobasidium botryosum (strain FD-172 SS1) TaxID=930990 RepID=A0A067MQW9_BOTB1|nr:hypothetical protein BOTBODRAFT_110345 [Botryobasidium botryosum FD-172 SS1]